MINEVYEINASGSEAKHIIDLLQAEAQGKLMMLPCEIGDMVKVDARTLPYNYLHPADRCGEFAKCRVIGFTKTKAGMHMKMEALYPSRMHKRGYLRYPISAVGKTVFLISN